MFQYIYPNKKQKYIKKNIMKIHNNNIQQFINLFDFKLIRYKEFVK